ARLGELLRKDAEVAIVHRLDRRRWRGQEDRRGGKTKRSARHRAPADARALAVAPALAAAPLRPPARRGGQAGKGGACAQAARPRAEFALGPRLLLFGNGNSRHDKRQAKKRRRSNVEGETQRGPRGRAPRASA